MKAAVNGFLILLVLSALAVAATWLRYQSLDPCDWTLQDMTEASGQPELVVEARIRAKFLIEGVVDPDFRECLFGWWDFRLDELPER